MAGGGTSGIVWFRRDLRVRDHPALRAALDAPRPRRPGLLLRRPAAARPPRLRPADPVPARVPRRPRRASCASAARGLVIRRGPPERELAGLAARGRRERDPRRPQDVEPVRAPPRRARPRRARRRRGRAPLAPGAERGRRASRSRPSAGKPYTVFSPFHRTWLEAPRRDVLEAPRELPPLPSRPGQGPDPVARRRSGSTQEVSDPARGGEAEAPRALDRFLDGPVREYADDHDALGRDRTSRLSPYLHFGCLSARADRGAPAARQGARGVSPPALLARLLPPRPRPLPAQRALGVPGPLPRLDPLELRASGRSRPGARGAPATRWSTPGCASCAARAGCTTAPGSSSARS